MESLVGYCSDEDTDERFDGHRNGGAGAPRRQDDTNYDDVTMDMSEDSNNNESDRELPPAEPEPAPAQRRRPRAAGDTPPRGLDRAGAERGDSTSAGRRRGSSERARRRDTPERRRDGRESPEKRRGESPEKRRGESPEKRRDGRESPERRREGRDGRERAGREQSPRRDERGSASRWERGRRGEGSAASAGSRRGLLGDRPDERADPGKPVPALMDLKPFGGEPPPEVSQGPRAPAAPADHPRDKDVRGCERDRRDREREKEKERDRDGHRDKDSHRDKDGHREKDRHGRRSQEKKSKKRSRSRSRGRRSPRDRAREHGAPAPPHAAPAHAADTYTPYAPRGAPASAPTAAVIPGSDYRPSYKVSKKLQVMEKMGLQIKTPDGSMATAQQLMQRTVAEQQGAATGLLAHLPSYYNPNAVNATKIVTQVQKRKLLWAGKKEEEAAPAAAVKWTGTKFAQDTDGRVANKFMRLMGIKDPAAVPPPAAEPSSEPDLNKKQEEMFQAMQAQYDVARVATHTMRGVGLGFQRHY